MSDVTTEQHPLDLASAAEEIGVHYQTAYRWVRTGQLPAFKVAGRYSVTRKDIDALLRARRAPTRPPAADPMRIHAKAERVYTALVEGDEKLVGQIVRTLVDQGATVRDLMTIALAPALHRIGQDWQAGSLAIGTEHRATAIVERLLGELTPNPRGRRRGTVVVAAIEGDRHTLPTTMAAVALREDHWTVHHLGSDMPIAELGSFIRTEPTDLVVLTVTEPGVAEAAEQAATSIRALGIPVIVGGPGRTLNDLVTEARGSSPSSAGEDPP
jgi:excisionase family DNA binding protein